MSETNETNEAASVDGDLDARAAAAFAELSEATKAESVPGEENATEEKPGPSEQEAPKEAEKTPDELRRERIAARHRQLEAFNEAERKKAEARAAKRAVVQTPPVEPLPVAYDAASFFLEAEKRGATPEQVAAWLSGHNDPTQQAEIAARRQLSPLEQKLEEQSRKLQQLQESLLAEREAQRIEQLVAQNTRILHDHVAQSKESAPLSFALLQHQPAMFRNLSNSICDSLPAGFTSADVIDSLEEALQAVQLQPFATGTSTQQKTKTAKASAPNIGNRIASDRATTVDSSDDDEGDLETRAKRLKARLSKL